MKKAIATLLFAAGIISAQTVSISGTVTSGTQPLPGVVVRLIASQLADTTDANGAYSLSGSVSTLVPLSFHSNMSGFRLERNMLVFNVAAPAVVRADIYTMTGSHVATLYKGLLGRGKHQLPFGVKALAQSVYLLKASVGSEICTRKIVWSAKGTFAISDPAAAEEERGAKKVAAFSDWLQGTKLGYSSHLEQVSVSAGVVNFSMNSNSSVPNFGPNVLVFDPSNASSLASQMASISSAQQGAQFGHNRYAWLFKPGSYTLDINVGFYTSALGLGLSPDSVQINGQVHSSSAWMGNNATCTFWKCAEGFYVTSSATNTWAASQGAPNRRMHVKGSEALSDGGWSSGGFFADCKFDGGVNPGSQQQYFSRNCNMTNWGGGGWNYTFVGCVGAPADNGASRTMVPKTPVSAEKPFLVWDGKTQSYYVLVPDLRRDSAQGISWANGATPGMQIPLDLFYITTSTDNAASLNTALAQGKNILFTPGHYNLESTVNVTRPGTILLGIGYPTLAPTQGNIAVKIADVDGVKIGGFLFEGTTTNAPVLLEIGDSGSTVDHSRNPTCLYDIFCRVGGEYNGLATCFVKINSNDVIFDHTWLWRADHGTGAGWNSNKNANGLVVNGNNVTVYGLFVEHTQAYQTWWNGENGRTYFYQSEMPYDPPNNTSWSSSATDLGYPSYKVSDNVKMHEARGLGVYSVFQNNVTANNALEVPAGGSGIKMHHMITEKLGGGTISNVINGKGGAASSSVLDYP